MALEIDWYSSVLNKPDPANFPTYYPKTEVDPRLVEALRTLAGRGHSAVFFYGSRAVGAGFLDSKHDFFVVTHNIRNFHVENIERGWIHYGWPGSLSFHESLNEEGPNYYQGGLPVGDRVIPMKVGVIEFRQFLEHLRGALEEVQEKGIIMLLGDSKNPQSRFY